MAVVPIESNRWFIVALELLEQCSNNTQGQRVGARQCARQLMLHSRNSTLAATTLPTILP